MEDASSAMGLASNKVVIVRVQHTYICCLCIRSGEKDKKKKLLIRNVNEVLCMLCLHACLCLLILRTRKNRDGIIK